MSPYDTYVIFLCLKHHFTKPNYDIFKYNWKTRASIGAYNKRKDRFFFERISRKKTEIEVKEFFISNFAATENPNGVYIPDLMKDGEEVYTEWRKKVQSLTYNFKSEFEVLLSNYTLNELLECKNNQHSILIKKYLQKSISIETIVILDKILGYVSRYDKILDDPIWESISLKIKKYSPFLEINKEKYIQILKEIICE
jgi:hypothetical protein